MAEPAIKFKRSKAKQTTSRNRDSPAPDISERASANEPVDDSPSPAILASKVKNKAKQRTKPKTALSFGGDVEVRGIEIIRQL